MAVEHGPSDRHYHCRQSARILCRNRIVAVETATPDFKVIGRLWVSMQIHIFENIIKKKAEVENCFAYQVS